MSHQKFDSKTTKKLLTNYQNTISKYASENEQLTRQLEDLKATLTLNQNLLYDFIKSSVGEDESINALISLNIRRLPYTYSLNILLSVPMFVLIYSTESIGYIDFGKYS